MNLDTAIQVLQQLAAQCSDPRSVELSIYDVAGDIEITRFEITRGDNAVYLEIH